MNQCIVLQIVTIMDRAGIENRLMDIYRVINKSKVQFHFFTLRMEKGYFDDEILKLGGKVFYNNGLSLKNINKYPQLIALFLKQHPEYKIVHCHLNQWCGIILKGAKMAGVPVRIAHSRAAANKINFKNILRNIVKLNINKNATDRFAVSDKAAIWLFGKRQYNKGNVTVWKNAIDANKFRYNKKTRDNVKDEFNLSDEFCVIHVGRDSKEKNHGYLLEIFESIQNKCDKSRLILVGDGDFISVKEKAKKLGLLDKLIFTGVRNDVYRLLQAADVFIFPSFNEGMPGAVLEAQASGLPCLISDSITKEVVITNLVEELAITEKPIVWAEKALLKFAQKRVDTYGYFQRSGFDIKDLTAKMTEYYLDKNNFIV